MNTIQTLASPETAAFESWWRTQAQPGEPGPFVREAFLAAWALQDVENIFPRDEGVVAISLTDAGECIAVTRQDEDYQILSIIWQRADRRLESTMDGAVTHPECSLPIGRGPLPIT